MFKQILILHLFFIPLFGISQHDNIDYTIPIPLDDLLAKLVTKKDGFLEITYEKFKYKNNQTELEGWSYVYLDQNKDTIFNRFGNWRGFYKNGKIKYIDFCPVNESDSSITSTYSKKGYLLYTSIYINNTESKSSDKYQIFYFDKNSHEFDYYPNGKLKSEYFLSGKKFDGKFKSFFKNGQLKLEGRYNYGKKTGTWIFYKKNGDLKKKKFFK